MYTQCNEDVKCSKMSIISMNSIMNWTRLVGILRETGRNTDLETYRTVWTCGELNSWKAELLDSNFWMRTHGEPNSWNRTHRAHGTHRWSARRAPVWLPDDCETIERPVCIVCLCIGELFQRTASANYSSELLQPTVRRVCVCTSAMCACARIFCVRWEGEQCAALVRNCGKLKTNKSF